MESLKQLSRHRKSKRTSYFKTLTFDMHHSIGRKNLRLKQNNTLLSTSFPKKRELLPKLMKKSPNPKKFHFRIGLSPKLESRASPNTAFGAYNDIATDRSKKKNYRNCTMMKDLSRL